MRSQRSRGRPLSIGRRIGGARPSGIALLDFRKATFTRTSEAAFQDPRSNWQFQGQDSGSNWKSSNEPRIFSDGAILIEGSRTNNTLFSEDITDSSWVAILSSITGNVDLAPDGYPSLDMLNTEGSTSSEIQQTFLSIDNNVSGSFRFFGSRSGSQTQTPRQIIGTHSGSITSLLSFENEGRYFSSSLDLRSGSSNVRWEAVRNLEAVEDSFKVGHFQFEIGGFPSSYIRTTDAAATRAADICSISSADVPKEIRRGRFSIAFNPEFSSEGIGSNVYRVLSMAGTGNPGILGIREASPGISAISYFNGISWINVVCLWNAHDEIEAIIKHGQTIEVRINGSSVGLESISGDWSAGTDLYIGSNQLGTENFFGIIHPPRRL